MQTLLVGLDAASPWILDRLADSGSIPTIASLVAEGASGTLTSQIPPWTASAWPSLYTGKNPGKHGVFGFLRFNGYDWTVVDGSDVREPALWEILDAHGYSSVVVNVPVTDPSRSFDGVLVPGYTAPNDPTCRPEGVLDAVTDATGGYRIYAPSGASDAATRRDWYRRLVAMRGAAFRDCCAEFDPEFGFLQFQQTDTVFHQESEFGPVRTVYEAVDAELSRTLSVCDPKNVVIASDHGIGQYEGTRCRLNEHLRDEGYLTTTHGGEGMPTWVTARDEQLRGGDRDSAPARRAGVRAVAALSTVGLTTERLSAALERVGLTDAVAEHVPLSVSRAGTEQVDFAASQAYVRDRVELGVRLNVVGREPDGVVPPGMYDSVRTSLIDSLAALETPAGDPVFETVAPREAYFHGPAAEQAVDVVTVPAGFDHLLSSTLGGDTFGPLADRWHHTLDGFVSVTGPAVREDAGVGDAQLFDVAPTVLATFDVPHGERMDGAPLPCIAETGSREYPRHSDRSTATGGRSTPGETVENHLAELGYLEER